MKFIRTSQMDESKSCQLIKMCKKMQKDENYINITELLQLTNVGIPSNDLTWARTKMNNEHCICVRHTCVKTKPYHHNRIDQNGHYPQYNGKAKFFLNEDDPNLSSSYESRRDYQLSYDKYSNGRNSISSDRSDESSKHSQSKVKKNSFNSKLRPGSEKNGGLFLIGNNLSVYKSENNLENNGHPANKEGRKLMTKSNSFNNIINNYRNGHYRLNSDHFYSINNQTIAHYNNNGNYTNNLPDIPRPPRLITQFTSILSLINPYDARISKFEMDYVKIAQLNPMRTFLAVATNYTVHAISIRSCKIIATGHMEESVDYITWLTPLIIAIVTSRTVYHWDFSANNTSQPVIVFFKSPKMYNSQIVNYTCDDTMSWFALSALYLEEDERTVTGLVQIHHVNEQIKAQTNSHSDLDANNNCFQQCIEAHNVTFARIKFDENNLESTTLIAIKKTSTNTIKVYIVELGPLKVQNNCLITRTEILRFNDNVNGVQVDIPLHNVICFKLSLIYVISKYGRLIICDLQTGIQLNEQQVICDDIVLSAKLDIADSQSIVLIARNGQVLHIEFDFEKMVQQFAHDIKLKKIARRISHALHNVKDEITRL